MIRLSLLPSDAATYWNMADVPATGTVNAPGYVRQSDLSINVPTIDNSKYSYFLQCKFVLDPQAGALDRLGLVGADVVYTITATNG